MSNAFLDRIRVKSQPFTRFGTAGVYFLFLGDELVYIGQSNNCEVRINQHADKGLKVFDRYAMIRLHGNRADRQQVEWQLIHIFKPKYNELPPIKNLQKSYTFSEKRLDTVPLIV